jgi:hypothetical protein
MVVPDMPTRIVSVVSVSVVFVVQVVVVVLPTEYMDIQQGILPNLAQ